MTNYPFPWHLLNRACNHARRFDFSTPRQLFNCPSVFQCLWTITGGLCKNSASALFLCSWWSRDGHCSKLLRAKPGIKDFHSAAWFIKTYQHILFEPGEKLQERPVPSEFACKRTAKRLSNESVDGWMDPCTISHRNPVLRQKECQNECPLYPLVKKCHGKLSKIESGIFSEWTSSKFFETGLTRVLTALRSAW